MTARRPAEDAARWRWLLGRAAIEITEEGEPFLWAPIPKEALTTRDLERAAGDQQIRKPGHLDQILDRARRLEIIGGIEDDER